MIQREVVRYEQRTVGDWTGDYAHLVCGHDVKLKAPPSGIAPGARYIDCPACEAIEAENGRLLPGSR